jgi:hypothetical protein
MNTTIRTVRDPRLEQAAQACDDAQTQVNQWAREITAAQAVIATLTAENNLLRAERDATFQALEAFGRAVSHGA